MDTVEQLAPEPRGYLRRLEPWMLEMAADKSRGVSLEKKKAAALVGYGRRRGWTMVQRAAPSGGLIVWRVA